MKNSTLYVLRSTLILFLLANIIGCEAFVRKFTRKSKKEEPKEEMVLSPQEYKSNMTKEEQYRQYLLFWQSWQDELISSLQENSSHKRQLDCAKEAVINLEQMRMMLKSVAQKRLSIYIEQLNSLKDAIENDTYRINSWSLRTSAERLRRNIWHEFSYENIKDSLV